MSSNNEDENERTSLLASASAPPEASRPSLLHPYNPRQQQQKSLSTNRPTLTSTTLEQMEKSAKRLADDNIDSDSVNGLLAGMEASDDEASIFGEGIGEEQKGDVTIKDLEFLAASAASRRVSDLGMEGIPPNGVMVDEIGSKLPRAQSPALTTSDDEDSEEDTRKQSFRAQPSHPNIGVLSERVHESTRALRASIRKVPSVGGGIRKVPSHGGGGLPRPPSHPEIEPSEEEEGVEKPKLPPLTFQVISMVALTLFIMALLAAALALGTLAVGPPRQPIGEYQITEAQVGENFWQYYDFYAGKDSAGSNGYITYVSREVAKKDGIAYVVTETVPEDRMIEIYEEGDVRAIEDWLEEDLQFLEQLQRQKEEKEAEDAALEDSKDGDKEGSDESGSSKSDGNKKKGSTKKKTDVKKESNRRLAITEDDLPPPKLEPFNPDLPTTNSTANGPPTETFVMISSSPTPEGPRNSVRLEGRRRFNRGLFIIDLRHMPGGCGTWPAFWLTDEANWPVNGEIDIVEGVNYQDTAKTALHTTRECQMDDVPEGSKTGSWDTAVGIPNRKTGIPDMTFRYAQNCFVYDPHQWINQGCVATDLKLEGRSLGMPLNANGGGVYALEWDPVNRHIRSWVFSPHGRVPSNLREALRTATEADPRKRVAPDTNQWGLPYGHFPIGEGTNCPAGHFRNMRLVINLAFCGSVAGNRYFMDCPKKFKKHKTCNEYVASNPEELKEAYWKIRGVYVYERQWERQWS